MKFFTISTLNLIATLSFFYFDFTSCSESQNCSNFKEILEEFKWTECQGSTVNTNMETFKFTPRSFKRECIFNSFQSYPPEQEPKTQLQSLTFIETKSHADRFLFFRNIPFVLKQEILSYLSSSELFSIASKISIALNLVKSVLFNRFFAEFQSMPIEHIPKANIDSFIVASKILKTLYPHFKVTMINDSKDLSCLLALSWVFSNDSKIIPLFSKTLYVIRFILITNRKLNPLSDLLTSDPTDHRKRCFLDIVDYALRENCFFSTELLFESNCIPMLITSDDLFWDSVYFYRSEKRFKELFDQAIDFDRNGNRLAMNQIYTHVLRILRITDNEVVLRAYLNHDASEGFDEDHLKSLILMIFEYSHTNLLKEIISNPKTLHFLESKPNLLLLPRDYFHNNHCTVLFFKTYQQSAYYKFNPDCNFHILKSISMPNGIRRKIDENNCGIFVFLLSADIEILPRLIKPILKVLRSKTAFSEISSEKFGCIQKFWDSSLVYAAFTKLSINARTSVLKEIYESRDYFHLLALSQTSFDYFALVENQNGLNYGPIKWTPPLILDEIFFEKYKLSDSSHLETFSFFLHYTNSSNYKDHPEFHLEYILKSLKYENRELFYRIFLSDSTQFPFDDHLKEIICLLPEGPFINFFWNSPFIFKYFTSSSSKDKSEELNNILMEQMVDFNKFQHLRAVINSDFNYYEGTSFTFDFIGFILDTFKSDTMTMITEIRKIWKSERFKSKFCHIHEQYNNDPEFLSLIFFDEQQQQQVELTHQEHHDGYISDSSIDAEEVEE